MLTYLFNYINIFYILFNLLKYVINCVNFKNKKSILFYY